MWAFGWHADEGRWPRVQTHARKLFGGRFSEGARVEENLACLPLDFEAGWPWDGQIAQWYGRGALKGPGVALGASLACPGWLILRAMAGRVLEGRRRRRGSPWLAISLPVGQLPGQGLGRSLACPGEPRCDEGMG